MRRRTKQAALRHREPRTDLPPEPFSPPVPLCTQRSLLPIQRQDVLRLAHPYAETRPPMRWHKSTNSRCIKGPNAFNILMRDSRLCRNVQTTQCSKMAVSFTVRRAGMKMSRRKLKIEMVPISVTSNLTEELHSKVLRHVSLVEEFTTKKFRRRLWKHENAKPQWITI